MNKKYLWNKKLFLIVLLTICLGFIFLLMKPSKEETLPEIEPIALVSVIKAKPQLIAKSMTVNGSINFVPEAMWQIYSPSEVIVDQILVHNGETIKKGQQLIKLKLSPASEANLNNAIRAVDFAKKDYERLQLLRSKYMASNAEVQIAQQTLLKAEADYHSFKIITQQLNLTAKSDGIVVNVSAQTGQIIPISTPLLNIGSRLHAEFNIDVVNKSKIKPNMQILVSNLNNMSYSILTKINNISGQIDATTGMVSFSATLPATSTFTFGDSVIGEIYLDSPQQQIAIPRSAILYQQNTPYVYINKNGKAQQEWVNIGSSNESMVYVINGISAGDEVITLGNYELESGMRIRVESKK